MITVILLRIGLILLLLACRISAQLAHVRKALRLRHIN
jgi:hypothetical protein